MPGWRIFTSHATLSSPTTEVQLEPGVAVIEFALELSRNTTLRNNATDWSRSNSGSDGGNSQAAAAASTEKGHVRTALGSVAVEPLAVVVADLVAAPVGTEWSRLAGVVVPE